MSSTIRRLRANTRERILSTDWNNATALHHRALIELGAAVLQGDTAVYGVVRGLTVSANGADLNVSVAAGLALRSGAAATTYDSSTQWIELRTAQTVDLSSYVDGANPRWVAIEIAEAESTEISENRDIFDPVTGTFSSASVVKVSGSAPTISVRTGTPAATPVFPSGGAGVIPLAYVYLGAGAASIVATDIVMCRPMLRGDTGGDPSAPQRDVYGGGVSVAASGLAVSLRNAGGRFAGHRARWGIAAADGTTAYTLTAQGMSGAALPVADDVIYFYVCPAPYPAGYDTTIAPREHRPGTSALTRYQGMVSSDLYNAVIVASTVEPQVDTPLGAPTAGNFTMTCAPFQNAATIDRTTAIYLGAAFWDFSATGFDVQDFMADLVVLERPQSLDMTTGVGTYSLWNSASGFGAFTDVLLPVTAQHVVCQIEIRDNDVAAGGGVLFEVGDDTGHQDWRFQIIPDAAAGGSCEQREQHTFYTRTGNIDVTTVTIAANDQGVIWGKAYRDCVLAQR